MNHKILIAYYTKGGASEEYAKVIKETLSKKELSVDLCNLADDVPDVSSYDSVILGTGVRMSMVYRRWKKILKQKVMKNKQLYLFLSSGMASEEPEKAVEKFLHPLVKKYNLTPIYQVSFPGKFPEKWAKYDEEQKMKMDPMLAEQWAEKIASHILHE